MKILLEEYFSKDQDDKKYKIRVDDYVWALCLDLDEAKQMYEKAKELHSTNDLKRILREVKI